MLRDGFIFRRDRDRAVFQFSCWMTVGLDQNLCWALAVKNEVAMVST